MKSLDEGFDRRLPLSHSLVRSLGVLHEFRGKEELYRQQMPESLETLRQVAVIQSTESSNRIEGVLAPHKRIRELVDEKTSPRDRPEQEIAGYRDVLNTIHANHQGIRLSKGVVQQLHRDLFKYTDTPGGRWKDAPNSITEARPDGTTFVRFEPIEPHLVDEAMEKLQAQFRDYLSRSEVDPLLLIAAYVLDFLCIHPFQDGNGRMARLLTLLLLYQSGYGVGRFVSLERIIEGSKETYYDTLYQSSQGWHSGKHPLTPWTQYLLGTLVAAYREFESRVGRLTTGRGVKSAQVTEVIDSFVGEFTTSQVQERCPNVGVDLIRRILKEKRDLGEVECLGRGPKATWRKI